MILEDLQAVPHTDPSGIIALRDGIYATDLLITAMYHLDFFTRLEHNPADFSTIINEFNIKARPADVMLTYFKALGLVETAHGVYRITEKAEEHLCADSQWSLHPYFSTQAGRPIVAKMLQVLRSGEPASWGGGKKEVDWKKAMERPDFAEQFTSGMDSRGAYFAPGLANTFDFSGFDSIIDIAGASGIYAACIKNKYPQIKAALLEKPPVDKIAKKGLARRGMQNQIKIFGADMFKDLIPQGYDIHLYSHVLHDWDMEQNRILLRNSYYSLKPGGIIMIHDAHVNRDKNGPRSVAEYSVLLMFSTRGKCYSTGEMEELLAAEGFRNIKYQATVGNRSIVTGEK